MIEFTNDELFEIEKLFDNMCLHAVYSLMEVVVKTEGDFADKLMSDAVSVYDTYRTISAKCQAYRNEKK